MTFSVRNILILITEIMVAHILTGERPVLELSRASRMCCILACSLLLTFNSTTATFHTSPTISWAGFPRGRASSVPTPVVCTGFSFQTHVAVVDGRNSGSGNHVECITDVSGENSLVNRSEFSVTHSAFRTARLHDVEFTLEHVVVCEQSSWTYWRREQT